jgi:hypothetical protein
MPKWRFDVLNLSAVHLGNRYLPTPARLFKDSAVKNSCKVLSKTFSLSWNIEFVALK